MQSLSFLSFIFLVVLFVLVPRAALRSARQFRGAQSEGKRPNRMRIVLSTMFALAVVGVIAVMNALAMGRNLFSTANVGLRDVGIGVTAFAVLLTAIPISRAMRGPDEERRRLTFNIAPRTLGDWTMYAVLAVLAGISEEAAYRGVAVWILTPIFGSIVPAIILTAISFAVAHAVQGGKTMLVVFGIALMFHALVWLTNTLVIAMVVHSAYDIVAGYAAAQRAQALGIPDTTPARGATPG